MKNYLVLLFVFTTLINCNGEPAARMFCKGQLEFYIVNRTRARTTDFREFTKISKSITDSYLKDFDIFAVRRNGYYGCFLMPQKGMPVYFDDLPDAAAFLSDRIGKVKSQNEAETIMRMLPALFSYQISEPTPENKFPYEIKQLDTGWQLTCRICGCQDLETNFQVTITIDNVGQIAVPKMKFTGTMLYSL